MKEREKTKEYLASGGSTQYWTFRIRKDIGKRGQWAWRSATTDAVFFHKGFSTNFFSKSSGWNNCCFQFGNWLLIFWARKEFTLVLLRLRKIVISSHQRYQHFFLYGGSTYLKIWEVPPSLYKEAVSTSKSHSCTLDVLKRERNWYINIF